MLIVCRIGLYTTHLPPKTTYYWWSQNKCMWYVMGQTPVFASIAATNIYARASDKEEAVKAQGIGAKIELTKLDYQTKEFKCHYI